MTHRPSYGALAATLTLSALAARPAAAQAPPPSAEHCATINKAYASNSYAEWLSFLDRCGATGQTDRRRIFDCGYAMIPPINQLECVRQELWRRPETQGRLLTIERANTSPTCVALVAGYQLTAYAAWMIALDQCKTGRGGLLLKDDVFACGFSNLPPRDQLPCLRTALEDAPVTPGLIARVRAFNAPADAIASSTSWQTSLPTETCRLPTNGSVPDGYFAPLAPPQVFDGASASFNVPAGQHLGLHEGRLRADLRQVARARDPVSCALPMSARTFAAAMATSNPATRNDLLITAQAYADLAVTGRAAFARFRARRPDGDYCAHIEEIAAGPGCPQLPAFSSSADVLTGCETALDRAYAVANYLRTGEAVVPGPGVPRFATDNAFVEADGITTPEYADAEDRKLEARRSLRWIAVSGEDDQPHRPVNVPSSDSPQFDVTVTVDAPLQLWGIELPFLEVPVQVEARYVIAQSRGTQLERKRHPKRFELLDDYAPTPVPAGSEVLLFIHGMDSRAEEAEDLTRSLFMRMRNSKKNLAIITVDLPSSGYTRTLDTREVSPLAALGHFDGYGHFIASGRTPLLDFLEDFVVRFAGELDTAGVSDLADVTAVMGGSLGGNLSLRLGRRPHTPWLNNVVAWSPASVWRSYGESPDPLVNLALVFGVVDAAPIDLNDPFDLSPGRIDRRRIFFGGWDGAMVSLLDWIVVPPQSETWYSDFYACKQSAIVGARLDRQETYDPRFQTWHARLGPEQLLYSHATLDLPTGWPRFMNNDKRMLLACGDKDAVLFNEICVATRITADVMSVTPGRAEYLGDTGHALDNERPHFWAREIDEFLGLR